METLHGIFPAQKVDEDTRAVVDSTFSLVIPAGMKVSSDPQEIGDDKMLVIFEPVEDDSFSETVNLEYSASNSKLRINSQKTKLDGILDLSNPTIRKKMENTLKDSLAKSASMLVLLGGEAPEQFIVKSDEEAVVVANDQGMLGVAAFSIIVPNGLYTGMYYVGDSETEDGYARPEVRRAFLRKLLGQVSLPNSEEMKDTFFLNARDVSYDLGQKEDLGICMIPVPDHMVFASEKQLPADLKERMSFVTVPEGTYRGPAGYQDVSVSIYGDKPLYIPGQKADWKNIVPKQTMPMTSPVTLVRDEDGLVAARFRYAGNDDPNEFWRSYVYTIFAGDNRLSGMFYFNQQAPEEVFENVVDTWLKQITLSSMNANDQLKMQKEALGQMAGKNGLIDAMAVIQLFQDDVLFFPEEPFDRSSGSLHLHPQVNQPKLAKYPYLTKHMEAIASGLGSLFLALDNEKSLQMGKEQLHQKLLPSLLDDRLTGLSFLNLLAYHLFRIHKTDKGYQVILDNTLAYGIPHIYDYVSRFLKYAREYNGITEPFEVEFMLANSLLSTDENGTVTGQLITPENAVPGADVGKMKKGSLVMQVSPESITEKAGETEEEQIKKIQIGKEKRLLQDQADQKIEPIIDTLISAHKSCRNSYNASVHQQIRLMQLSDYSSRWDSSYQRDMRKLKDILNSYGEQVENAINNALDKYEKEKKFLSSAARKKLLDKVNYVAKDLEETEINNTSTGENFKYSLSWPLDSQLQRFRKEIEGLRTVAWKEQRERRNQISDENNAEFALKHQVSLSDVENHQKYLEAKSQMNSSKSGDEFRNTAKLFKNLNGYLDAVQMEQECLDKAREQDDEIQRRITQWESDCRLIDQKRKEYHQQLNEQALQEYQKDLKDLEQDHQKKQEKLQQEINDLETQIHQLKTELEGLGFLAVFRKRDIQRQIEDHKQNKDKMKKELDHHKEQFNMKSEEKKNDLELKQKSFHTTVREAFPYPEDPRKPASLSPNSPQNDTSQTKPINSETARHKKLEADKAKIKDIIYNSSTPLTVMEVNKQLSQQGTDISNQRTSALLRLLSNDGEVIREEYKRIAKFRKP